MSKDKERDIAIQKKITEIDALPADEQQAAWEAFNEFGSQHALMVRRATQFKRRYDKKMREAGPSRLATRIRDRNLD